ncbi:MAG: trypsin-like peptidase domain-containing protein, partial [Chloroflexota bacterium]|nr:trypsin-like peptidase domain-containing protein [Chloroflexota bacterium]
VLVRSTLETTDASGRTSTGISRGSGVVFNRRGYIITNHHVIEDAVKVDVVFSDGRPVDVEVVGSDIATDLAVLRLPSEFVDDSLVVTTIGDSDAARVGEWVVAIGNPLGFEGSVTVGVISAKDRSLQISDRVRLHDLIQTDAVINPGNSGGPLLNLDGQVLGINTAIIRGQLASGQEAEGIGFAVAATTVIPVAQRIIEDGRVIWPRIGVSIEDVD